MKKVVFLSSFFLMALTSASSALAYGGGGGFPPGWYDNPHAHKGLTCEFVERKWGNGNKFYLPWCHLKENAPVSFKNKHKETGWQGRFKNFLAKVQHGNRNKHDD